MRKLILTLTLISGIAYAEKFDVGLNIGYGSTTQNYNEDGKVDDDGTLSALNLNLFGKYYILSQEMGPKVYIGGDFSLSQHQFSLDGGSISSGFAPQYINLILGGSFMFFNGKLGFQLDLGPKPDLNNDKFINSDRQNAILFGVGTNVPFMEGLGDFHANLDYILTLEKTEDNSKYDMGDYLFITVGGGYKFALSELSSFGIGLDIVYKLRIPGELELGYNLSLLPYISYKTGPISTWLKLGARNDFWSEGYGYDGFSIIGKRDWVTRLGFTAGILFSY